MKTFTCSSWTLSLVFAVLFIDACIYIGPAAGRGARFSGGFRSSYRSSGTSYRSSGTSYRSSSYGSRSPSQYSSRYVSYVPPNRYSRAYTRSSLGSYSYYYNMYFAYSGSAVYLRRTRPTGSVGVCVNYEASENDTVMGVFTCPLPFEPREFTYCCGTEYAEYCCEHDDNTGKIVGIVVGSVFGFILLCGLWACIRKHYYRSKTQVKPVERQRQNGQLRHARIMPATGRQGPAGQPKRTPYDSPPYSIHQPFPPPSPTAPVRDQSAPYGPPAYLAHDPTPASPPPPYSQAMADGPPPPPVYTDTYSGLPSSST